MKWKALDSSKMLTHFLRAVNSCRSLPCPAGGRDMEDPTGASRGGFRTARGKQAPATEINRNLKIPPDEHDGIIYWCKL
ncbi:hypothetical protein B4U37_18435 [Sutcliffiella horikoshii]|uniref:Transposase n=1 Tax=Sutcliffiella horikoshii TaxID=79883 RepID=A0ABM6KN25_9BACI|nr:hypothetical protein B4U37_18435 [Sutcliffiella horikoshii]